MRHFIFIALIFFLALPCAGQEGRGQWVKTEQSFEFTTGESAYMFWWFDSLSSPDSVWVPEEMSAGAIIAASSCSMYSSDTSLVPADTYYQESQQRWRWEEEYERKRCQEIWECVREKLIEFLEEREH